MTNFRSKFQLLTNDILGFVLRGFAPALFTKASAISIQFVQIFLFARYLELEAFGIYAFFTSLLAISMIFLSGGVDTYIIRYAPKVQTVLGLNNSLLFTYSTLLSAILVMIVVASPAFLIALLLFFIFDQLAVTFVIALFIAVVLSVANRLLVAIGAWQGYPIVTRVVDEVIRPIVTILIFTSILFNFDNVGLDVAISSQITGIFVAFLIHCWLLFRRHSNFFSSFSRRIVVVGNPFSVYKHWYNRAFPFLFVSGGTILLHELDTVMLAVLASTESAAVYRVTSRLIMFVSIVVMATGIILPPRLAQLRSAGDWKGMRDAVFVSGITTFFFASGNAAILLVLGEWLLGIFGPVYTLGMPVLWILVPGAVLSAVGATGVHLLTISSGARNVTLKVILSVSVAINILLNATLVPLLQEEGAAMATVFSSGFLSCAAIWFGWRSISRRSRVR